MRAQQHLIERRARDAVIGLERVTDHPDRVRHDRHLLRRRLLLVRVQRLEHVQERRAPVPASATCRASVAPAASRAALRIARRHSCSTSSTSTGSGA
jgi:hypothetical protein